MRTPPGPTREQVIAFVAAEARRGPAAGLRSLDDGELVTTVRVDLLWVVDLIRAWEEARATLTPDPCAGWCGPACWCSDACAAAGRPLNKPPAFAPGDLLRVLPRNGCGLGIDVRRESDGAADMVWPEEVEVVRVIWP